MKRSLAVATIATIVIVVLPSPASAEPTAAKQAYDQGVEAYERGDLEGASQQFARADTLAPNAVSLQAALDAAIDADDAALVSELLQRSKRGPAPPNLAASITAAHLKFQGRLSPEATSSTATLAPRPERDGGLPPIVVYGGLGLTTILAGLTTYFALDTSHTHDTFTNAGCDQTNLPECGGLKNEGESSQQLANIGFAATIIVGLATAIIGFGFTDWKAPILGRTDRTGLGRSPNGASAAGALRVRF